MRCGKKCWFVFRDPLGIVISILGYMQISFVAFCTIYFAIFSLYGYSGLGLFLSCLMLFLVVMVVWCGIMTTFTEPGQVIEPIKVSDEARAFYLSEETHSYCSRCSRMKPERAHHCSKCKTCILKMDHHCPWVNNCIGARNQKYFILYLVYVHIGEILAIILSGAYIYQQRHIIYWNMDFLYLSDFFPTNRYVLSWLSNHIMIPLFDSDILPQVLTLIELFFSLFFSVFVVVLFIDQYKAIRYDLTYVEYLKSYHIRTVEHTFYDCVVSTMGEPPCWRWFFPIEGRYMFAIMKKLSKEFISFKDDEDSNEEELTQTIEEKKNQ